MVTHREAQALIEAANELPLAALLEAMHGVYVDRERPAKYHCPFGHIWHSDGGVDRALRFYPDSNTAFCFAGCGFLNPVRLAQVSWDIRSPIRAASELLEKYAGPPPTWEERLAKALSPRTPELTQACVAALHQALSGDPGYATLSLHPTVLAATEECLDRLENPRVGDPSVTDPEIARRWLRWARARVRAALLAAEAQSPAPTPPAPGPH